MTRLHTLSSDEPFVSIIVPSFRRPDVLCLTLRALSSLNYPANKHEVIVVDDGSGDETTEVVRAAQAECERVRYREQPNSGVATARNNGARAAAGEYLIFIDDDIVVEPDFINHHLRVMREFDRCFVNGRWEFTPDFEAALQETPFGRFRLGIEQWIKQGEPKKPLHGSYLETESATAQNLGVRAEDYWKVGGFDEDFPYAGREDQEFSMRAAKAGYRFIRDESLHVLQDDRRLTLRQFCGRKQRDAVTVVLLASKYPQWMNAPMVAENSLVHVGDSPRTRMKKACKRILSMRPALEALHSVIAMSERIGLGDRVLHKFYWMMCGLYIYVGVQQGFRQLEGKRTATR